MGAGRSVCKGTKIFLTAAAQRMQSFFLEIFFAVVAPLR
jgi:hypothetical protein